MIATMRISVLLLLVGLASVAEGAVPSRVLTYAETCTAESFSDKLEWAMAAAHGIMSRGESVDA